MPWGFAAAAVVGAVGSTVAAGEQASGQQAAANTQAGMFNTLTQQEAPFIQGGYSAEDALLNGLGLPPSSTPASTSVSTPVPLSNLMGGGLGALGGSGVPIAGLNTSATSSAGTAPTGGLPSGYLTQTFNPTDAQLEAYPGYEFQLNQGDLALNSANSAGGSALSGAAMKGLMSFNQGLAASNYQNYFNQFQTQQNNIFNRLNTIATMGQNAAGNLGTAGTSLGTGIAQAQAGAAASIAGGIAGASNNIGQSILLSQLGNTNSNPYAGSGSGTGTLDAGGGYTFNTGGS
jgi:hypothetical protein